MLETQSPIPLLLKQAGCSPYKQLVSFGQTLKKRVSTIQNQGPLIKIPLKTSMESLGRTVVETAIQLVGSILVASKLLLSTTSPLLTWLRWLFSLMIKKYLVLKVKFFTIQEYIKRFPEIIIYYDYTVLIFSMYNMVFLHLK